MKAIQFPLNSRKILDADGQPLRTNHFPFQLERRSPPRSAGYNLRGPKPIDRRPLRASASRSSPILPTTLLMVDYNQDRKKITTKSLMESVRQDRTLTAPTSFNNMDRRNSSTNLSNSVGPTQSLRSSFVPQQMYPSNSDLDLASSKEDAATETEPDLLRQDLSISAYQNWSSKIVEPFFKVRLFTSYHQLHYIAIASNKDILSIHI
jgi:hypothetical protein